MKRKWTLWIPTLVLVAGLVAGGWWLYQSVSLPFMEAHHSGHEVAFSSQASMLALSPNHGDANGPQPLQTLPKLLGDLWLIATVITGVRLLQGAFPAKTPAQRVSLTN